MSKWLRQVELVNCVSHQIALIHTVHTNATCFAIQGMLFDSLTLGTLYFCTLKKVQDEKTQLLLIENLYPVD